MPCGHRIDILRNCSVKLLADYLYFVASREFIDTPVTSSKNWAKNSRLRFAQDLIVLGGTCINQVKARPFKVQTKISVEMGTFPIKWQVCKRNIDLEILYHHD